MMEALPIQVFSEEELVKLLQQDGRHYSHCISIGNPRRLIGRPNEGETIPTIIKTSFRSILRLSFFDTEDKSHLGPMRPKRIPELRDIRKVKQFYLQAVSQNKRIGNANGFTIHCWRGISRSPAIALGLFYLMTKSEKDSIECLRRIRPDARPLQRIVALFDREFASNLSEANAALRDEVLSRLKNEIQALAGSGLEELESVDEG